MSGPKYPVYWVSKSNCKMFGDSMYSYVRHSDCPTVAMAAVSESLAKVPGTGRFHVRF